MAKFNVGDKVRITSYGDLSHLSAERQAAVKQMVGLEAVVADTKDGWDYEPDVWLMPMSDRPDTKYPRAAFFWPEDKLELVVSEAEKKLDEVRDTLTVWMTEDGFNASAALREISRIVGDV